MQPVAGAFTGAYRGGAPGGLRRGAVRRTVVSTLVCTVFATPVAAQTIRGVVLEREGSRPIALAHVLALDPEARVRAGALSAEDGRFVLRVPGPGAYSIRVDRIGFRSGAPVSTTVATGNESFLEIRLDSHAVELPPLTVETTRQCRFSGSQGSLLADLWAEARKALDLATAQHLGEATFVRARDFERTLDVATGDVVWQRSRTWAGFSHDPYVGASPGDLAERGFVQVAGDSVAYFGLSATVLLSMEFERTHCFQAKPPGRGQSRDEIGLAFEPAPGRPAPDVAGVLWLDRRSAELRRVEYGYTAHALGLEVPADLFGGRMDFARQADGRWIVSRWWIRMPQFEGVVESARLPRGSWVRGDAAREAALPWELRRAGLSIREVGGQVLATESGSAATASVGVVAGSVWDGLRASPLVGGVIFDSGSQREARTDSQGRFTLDSVPVGERRIGVQAAILDALGLESPSVVVRVEAGDTTRTGLALPSADSVLGARCRAGESYVLGFASLADRSAPPQGWEVTARWSEGWERRGDPELTEFRGRPRALGTLTDAAGAYVLCGVPAMTRVTLELSAPGAGVMRRVQVEIPAHGRGRADLVAGR